MCTGPRDPLALPLGIPSHQTAMWLTLGIKKRMKKKHAWLTQANHLVRVGKYMTVGLEIRSHAYAQGGLILRYEVPAGVRRSWFGWWLNNKNVMDIVCWWSKTEYSVSALSSTLNLRSLAHSIYLALSKLCAPTDCYRVPRFRPFGEFVNVIADILKHYQ